MKIEHVELNESAQETLKIASRLLGLTYQDVTIRALEALRWMMEERVAGYIVCSGHRTETGFQLREWWFSFLEPHHPSSNSSTLDSPGNSSSGSDSEIPK